MSRPDEYLATAIVMSCDPSRQNREYQPRREKRDALERAVVVYGEWVARAIQPDELATERQRLMSSKWRKTIGEVHG